MEESVNLHEAAGKENEQTFGKFESCRGSYEQRWSQSWEIFARAEVCCSFGIKNNSSRTFLKTQDFQKVFFTARSPDRATVKHYRFNDRRVVYVSLISFQIRTYVTKESNTFRQLLHNSSIWRLNERSWSNVTPRSLKSVTCSILLPFKFTSIEVEAARFRKRFSVTSMDLVFLRVNKHFVSCRPRI